MKYLPILLSATLLAIVATQPGCATRATANQQPVNIDMEPSVKIRVVGFDPHKAFRHKIGTVNAGMVGQAVLNTTVSPPGWRYTIEASPDMENWIESPPLRERTLESGKFQEVVESVHQIFIHPDTGSNDKQFWRVVY